MKSAVVKPLTRDPLTFVALGSALIVLAILSAFAAQPKLMTPFSASPTASFSKEMRGESNGETGRDYSMSEIRDI